MTYRTAILTSLSAGQAGPKSPFFKDESAPENKDPQTLGSSMFDAEDFEGEISRFRWTTADKSTC